MEATKFISTHAYRIKNHPGAYYYVGPGSIIQYALSKTEKTIAAQLKKFKHVFIVDNDFDGFAIGFNEDPDAMSIDRSEDRFTDLLSRHTELERTILGGSKIAKICRYRGSMPGRSLQIFTHGADLPLSFKVHMDSEHFDIHYALKLLRDGTFYATRGLTAKLKTKS